MSDFFEQILSRAFGATADVRPRLAARFETADRIDTSAEKPWPVESEAPTADALSTKANDAYRLRAAIPEESAAQPSSTHAHDHEPPLEPASPARPIETGLRPGAEPTGMAAPSSLRLNAEGHAPAKAAKLELAGLTSPSPSAKAVGTEDSAIRRRDHPSEDAAERATEARAPAAAQLEPAQRNRLAALPEAKPAAVTPTVVHVTIGRVEIRLPPSDLPRPAAPRTASAPAKPARSLGDYLRRRNGGER